MRGESSEELELLKLLFQFDLQQCCKNFQFSFCVLQLFITFALFSFFNDFCLFCLMPFAIHFEFDYNTHTQNIQHTYEYNQLLPHPALAPTCTSCTHLHILPLTPSPSSLLILFYVFLLSTSSCAFVFAHFNECS